MKRSRTSSSASVKSPQTRNQKRSKYESPVSHEMNTPDSKGIQSSFSSVRTSGGISKSLLTPCRRMGLGRNRKLNLNSSQTSITTSPLTTKTSIIHSDDNSNAPDLESEAATKKTVDGNVSNVVVSDISRVIQDTIHTDENKDPKLLANVCVNIINERILKKKNKKKVPVKEVPVQNGNKDNDSVDILAANTILMSPKIALTLQQKGAEWTIKDKDGNSSGSTPNLSQKSSSSYISDNDDDADFESKTILERKSYKKTSKKGKLAMNKDKVVTQKDLDDIRERIKIKEEKLKSQEAHGHSIEELGELIVTWRGGCREALENLLEVGKQKGKIKENVDMEQLLTMLQIPCELVKYNTNKMAFE